MDHNELKNLLVEMILENIGTWKGISKLLDDHKDKRYAEVCVIAQLALLDNLYMRIIGQRCEMIKVFFHELPKRPIK